MRNINIQPLSQSEIEKVFKENITLIGENVKRLRIEQGLTQKDLSIKSTINRHTIKQVENNHWYEKDFRLKSLSFIAKALGVELQELLINHDESE